MTLPISKYVWFDKKYVLTKKAKVPITTHAIHYGTSIFEGIRAYWNGKNLHVFRLDEHVKRFRRSGQFYNISLNYSDKVVSDAIIGICKKNNIKKSSWKEDVPECIAKIIEEEWKTVVKFASSEDMTTRVVGMKFPKEGWSKK